MSTKYKFTGNQQEYEATLRQFTLDELLKCINRESVHLLYDQGMDHHAMKAVSVPIIQFSTKLQENKEVFITAWKLIDLAYNAICAMLRKKNKSLKKNMVFLSGSHANHKHMPESGQGD